MKKGFTLSETLVALAIVGIVASLTIPRVIDSYTKKTYVRSLQSVNNSLKDVITQVQIKERVSSLADTSLGTSAETFFKRYFDIAIDCGTSHTKCLADSYRSLDKTNSINTSSLIDDKYYCIALRSGATICMTKMSNDSANEHGYSTVFIDVNGRKQPNINGRDLFDFKLYTDGKMANSYKIKNEHSTGTTCTKNASNAEYGGACYSKIIADGWSMDY